MVRERQAQHLRQLPGPPSHRRPAQQGRHHLAGRTRRGRQGLHLPDAAYRGLPLRQCPEKDGGKARRPGIDLPADDSRTGGQSARLHPDRRHSQRGLRRFLGPVPEKPDPGLRGQGPGHRRRRHPGRQDHPLETQCRRCPEGLPLHPEMHCREAGRQRSADAVGPRPLVSRRTDRRRHQRPVRAGEHGRRGHELHPLHLRLHRQTQGRGAHHRRLSDLRRPYL